MWKAAFKNFKGSWSTLADHILWNPLKFFKGCLQQNLLSPLKNALSQKWLTKYTMEIYKYISLLEIRLFSFRPSPPSPLPKTSNIIGQHHVHHYDDYQVTVSTNNVISKKLLTIFTKKLGSKHASDNFHFSLKTYFENFM